jgi:hypothetical protein
MYAFQYYMSLSIGDDIAAKKISQLYTLNRTYKCTFDKLQPKDGKYKYLGINVDQFYRKKKAIAKDAKKDPVFSELETGKKDF